VNFFHWVTSARLQNRPLLGTFNATILYDSSYPEFRKLFTYSKTGVITQKVLVPHRFFGLYKTANSGHFFVHEQNGFKFLNISFKMLLKNRLGS
jgi:hypothetical protein